MSESYHPIVQIFIGQGSVAHLRRRANKILKLEVIGNGAFSITGGENDHIVRLGSNSFECDCLPFVRGDTKRCSHIVKTAMFLSEQLQLEKPDGYTAVTLDPEAKKARKRKRRRYFRIGKTEPESQ